MKVTGKVIIMQNATYEKDSVKEDAIATIELPPVDKELFKEGDEVWVKTSISKIKPGSDFIELNCCNDLIDIESIILHFPQLQPKQEKNNQEVKVPEKLKECPLSMFDNSAWRAWMAIAIIKINEIIGYLEKKE